MVPALGFTAPAEALINYSHDQVSKVLKDGLNLES